MKSIRESRRLAVCVWGTWLALTVVRSESAEVAAISPGDSWRYLDNGTRPPGWNGVDFNDAAWKVGAAPLGYGDPGMGTTVGFGSNSGSRHITTYFRKEFHVERHLAVTSVSAEVRRDDGAVIYLNGTEVYRTNMPSSPIAHPTLAQSTVSDSDETRFFSFIIDYELVRQGKNVLAVEVHQVSPSSSDLAFDASLVLDQRDGEMVFGVQDFEGIRHFLVGSVRTRGHRILRFDAEAGHWLAPILLGEGLGNVQAFQMKDDGILCGSLDGVFETARDGSNPREIVAFPEFGASNVSLILGWRDYVIYWGSSRGLTVVRADTGAVVSSQDISGLSVTARTVFDEVNGRLFVVESPRYLHVIQFSANGRSATEFYQKLPDAGSERGAVYASPDGRTIVTSEGSAYRIDDTRHLPAPAIHQGFQALAFLPTGDRVVLRDGHLVVVAPNGGDFGLPHALAIGTPGELMVGGEALHVSSGLVPWGANEVPLERVELASLAFPEPQLEPDYAGVTLTGVTAAADRDGVLYTYAPEVSGLIRWSSTAERFLEPVPSRHAPACVAYDAGAHALYLGYPDGMLTRLALGTVEPEERPFASVPSGMVPGGFAFSRNAVAVASTSGTGQPRDVYLFDGSGSLGGQAAVAARTIHVAPDGETLVYASGNTLGRLRVNADGSLSDLGAPDFPLGILPTSGSRFFGSAGEDTIIGSGSEVFDLSSLGQKQTLAFDPALHTVVGAAFWPDSAIVARRGTVNASQVPFVAFNALAGPALKPGEARVLNGQLLGVFPVPGGWGTVMQHRRFLRFSRFDGNFALSGTSTPPEAPALWVASPVSPREIVVEWRDRSLHEEEFFLEAREFGGRWKTVGAFPADTTSGRAAGFAPGTSYSLRMRARNETGTSAFESGSMILEMPSDDGTPAAPFDTRAVRRFHNAIFLEWTDRSLNETGFRIERSTVAFPSPSTPIVSFQVPEDTAHFVDNTVASNTVYYYQVFAVNRFGASGDIRISAASLFEAAPPASVPGVKAIPAHGEVLVRLQWHPGPPDVESFIIYRRDVTGDGGFEEIARLSYGESGYADDGVIPGRTYAYRVVTENRYGEGGISEPDPVVVPPLGGVYGGAFAIDPNGVIHFAYANPPRLERFDSLSGQRMPAWPLPFPPSAVVSHEGEILVSLATGLARLGSDGSVSERYAAGANAIGLESFGPGRIAVLTRGGLAMLSGTDGGVLGFVDAGAAPGLSMAVFPEQNLVHILGEDHHLRTATIAAEGGILAYESRLPPKLAFITHAAPTRLLPLPGGREFAYDTGTRLTGTLPLVALPNLAGPLADVRSWNSHWVLAEGRRLALVDPVNGREIAVTELPFEATTIVPVGSGKVNVFGTTGGAAGGVQTLEVAMAEFGPRAVAEIDLAGLRFLADQYLSDGETLYCLNRELSAIFRWSSTLRRALAPIPLYPEPLSMGLPQDRNELLVQYADGRFTRIDLSGGEPVQSHLFNAVTGRSGFIAMDSHIGVSASFGMAVFDREGALTEVIGAYGASPRGSLWVSPASQLLSANGALLHTYQFADGTITAQSAMPFSFAPVTWEGPVLFSPDRQKALVGGNRVLEVATGNTLATMYFAETYQWTSDGDCLGAVKRLGQNWEIDLRSGQSYEPVRAGAITGPLLALLEAGGHIVAVTRDSDLTLKFSLLDPDDLAITRHPEPRPSAPKDLRVSSRTSSSIGVVWQSAADVEHVLEIRPKGTTRWTERVRFQQPTDSHRFVDLLPGVTYEIRLTAQGADLVSEGTSLAATTLSGTVPSGEPYHLRAARLFATTIHLAWDDNATTESGFRIYRADGAGSAFSDATALSPAGPDVTVLVLPTIPSTSYTFWVQAFNDDGGAELSEALTLTTLPTDSVPPVGEPSRIELTGSSAEGVSLRWMDGSPNEAGFRIYRSRVAGDVGSLVGTVAYNIDHFTDITAQPGVAYYYRVAAYNGFGELMQTSLPLLVETESVGGSYSGLYFRRDGVLYFAVDGPPRIERFDLNAGDYIGSVPLPGAARSLWIDQGGMIVSTPQHIVTYDGTFRAEFPVGRSFDQIFKQNGHVHARTSPTTYRSYFGGYTAFQTRNVDAPLSVLAREFDAEILGIPVLSQSTSGSRLGLLDLFPPDFRVELGTALPGVASGTGIFAFPDGKRVVTGSGTVFSLTQRAGVGQWMAGIDDIAFRGDAPIARHGDELVVYSNLLSPVSRRTLADRPAKIAVGVAGVFLFHADPTHPHGLDLEVISFEDLGVPVPDAPLGIEVVRVGPGEPAAVEGGHLVLPLRMAAFPWNPADRSWYPGIGLRDVPSVLGTYSSNQSLLTGHVDGLLDYSNSLEGNGILRSFPDPIVALATLPQGRSLAATAGPTPKLHFLNGGSLRHSANENVAHGGLLASPRGGVAYFRSLGEIVSLPFSESAFGSRRRATLAPADLGVPVAIGGADFDESILLSSGSILDAGTLMPTGARVPGGFRDAVWSDPHFILLSAGSGGHARLEARDRMGILTSVMGLPGEPLGIHGGQGGGEQIITLVEGVPTIHQTEGAARVIGSAMVPPVSLHPVVEVGGPGSGIDLAEVFGSGDPWALLTYKGIVLDGTGLVISARVDLETDRLHIQTSEHDFGQSIITLTASNGAGEVMGTVRLNIPPPEAPEITVLSPPTLNRETGLYEQRLRVSNNSGRGLGAFALHITGLVRGIEVYNRSANAGKDAATIMVQPLLDDGDFLEIVVEYLSLRPGAPGGIAFSASPLPLFVPGQGDAKGAFCIDRAALLDNRSVVLEFWSEAGAEYQIEFSENGVTWTPSHRRIRAGGHRVQWMDSGPPKTPSAPTSGGNRFYRVRKLPPP